VKLKQSISNLYREQEKKEEEVNELDKPLLKDKFIRVDEKDIITFVLNINPD
jgi:hypothetical protein